MIVTQPGSKSVIPWEKFKTVSVEFINPRLSVVPLINSTRARKESGGVVQLLVSLICTLLQALKQLA